MWFDGGAKLVKFCLLQICNANNLLDILLKEMEGADPDAIANTIILLMRHIQPGNKTSAIGKMITWMENDR